ncbi:MAG: PEP-CTERM sorting domain-containing protein [Gemmatimonadota bacterium]|nr:PEP-CTERM sorting domain-containing protein [Gemmatimonadota bacterium]
MRKLFRIFALALLSPLAAAQAQTYNLFPTDAGGQWQVKCTVIPTDAPPTGPCNGNYFDVMRVTASPGGWSSVPVAGPAGNAYYVSPYASATVWSNAPNENPHYEYTFKTTFSVFAGVLQAINLNVFRLDNYFVGWSLNGGTFSALGMSPGPLGPNGNNWTTPFQLAMPGSGFVNGTNTLEIRIQGNGRTDAILAQGTYTVTPPLTTTTAPEPAAMVLMATGLLGLMLVQRARRSAKV